MSPPIPSSMSSGLPPAGYDCVMVPGPTSPMMSSSEPVAEFPVEAVPDPPPSKSSIFYSPGLVAGTVTSSMSSRSPLPAKYAS